MKVIQVLDYYASGNAVANCAVTYYKYCKRLGMDCAIVARLIDKQDDIISDMTYLRYVSEDDVIMYHLCIGTPLNIEICGYKCKKVLVYHNITPPKMLVKYDVNLANACQLGLTQLAYMRNYFDICLADSEFNKQDLIKAGYLEDNITVIPPFVSREDFSKSPDPNIVKKMNDGWTNILFVGRVSPHKKYEDSIRIFDYYKKNINPRSRLIFAGGIMESYYQRLIDYVQDLKLSDVIFTKQISFAHLLALYSTADVFLCSSEHEGYCIPLIEGMAFNIPVIAYDAGAVRGTMGNSGIVINDKNPIYVSKIIDKVVNDTDFREGIIEGQKLYLETIDDEHIFNMFSNWINKLENKFAKIEEIDSSDNSMEDVNPYDVVVVIKADDWDIAKNNLKYIRKNLRPKKIVIVSSDKIKTKLTPEDGVNFINEDTLYQGMSFAAVREIFEERGISVSLTGWFLQQFLKMAYAFVCKDDYYLVWDADTIPVRSIAMIDDIDGKPLFNMKPEYVAPYFSTLYNLLRLKKCDKESFITEHMLFNTNIMKDLISKIENNPLLCGISFYDKIIDATDFRTQGNSFSEFETYGTFCEYYYPNVYKKRHLKTFRGGKMFLGTEIDDDILEWVAADFDTISFEYQQPVLERSRLLSHDRKFRSKKTFMNLISRIYLTDTLSMSPNLCAEKAVLEMEYPWRKQPAYLESNDYCELVSKRGKYKTVKFWQPSISMMLFAEKFIEEGWNVLIYDPEGECRKSLQSNPFIGANILQSSFYGNITFYNKTGEIAKTEGIDFVPMGYDCEKFFIARNNCIMMNCLSDQKEFPQPDDMLPTLIDVSMLSVENMVKLEKEPIVLLLGESEVNVQIYEILYDKFKVCKSLNIDQYYHFREFIMELSKIGESNSNRGLDDFFEELLKYFNLYFVQNKYI